SRKSEPYDHNDPDGQYFNINIGTNTSFRRSALIEVGAFDEEIEYYHDESDVCVRLVKSGYKVVQLDRAFVHHKMAPSFRRVHSRTVTTWDAIVKNTLYLGVKSSAGKAGLVTRIVKFWPIEFRKFVGMFTLLLRGQYGPWQYIVRNFSLVR